MREDIREQSVDKIAEALYRSRNIVGKSQEFMALELGVSRKTIQNWERGTSAPSIEKAIEWFRILNMSPVPFLFQYLFPYVEKINVNSKDEEQRNALRIIIDELPNEAVKQLLFLLYGEHGSSPRGILNLMTAHLQTSMKDRLTQARVILNNYELALKKNELSSPANVKPDVAFLKKACEEGERAVLSGASGYVCKE